jgi:hypothetical protein
MTDDEVLRSFERKNGFLFRYGSHYRPGEAAPLRIKLCLTSTQMAPMARALFELSNRDDCFVVKMDAAVLGNGMVRGRCFLTSVEAVAEVWRAYKVTPTLLCTIQDDNFTVTHRTAAHSVDAGHQHPR